MSFVTDIKSLLKSSFIVQAIEKKKAELKLEWGINARLFRKLCSNFITRKSFLLLHSIDIDVKSVVVNGYYYLHCVGADKLHVILISIQEQRRC